MEFPVFIYLALLLLVALLSTRLMKVLKLPNVTGYIITGILMGPFVFGLLFGQSQYQGAPQDNVIYQYVTKLSWVSQVALGFIAFSIGTSFRTTVLRSVGKRVIVITILEAFAASLCVFLALFITHLFMPETVPLAVVLTLSAIASATAPAATLMVIKQYKAQGPLVNTLLPVVALDDAAALMLFAILFHIATALLGGGDANIYTMLLKPLLEIVMSLAIGAAIGGLISLINKIFKSRNNKLVLCIFSVFLSVGLYYLFKQPQLGGFELSSLLMCMMTGAMYTNLAKDSNRTLDVLERFTSPIYMMFFVFSGASLDLSIFFNKNGLLILLIAVVYIIFRVVGKYLGAFTGAVITKCEPQIKKYLGLTLIPQAGVAIGLATTASSVYRENADEKIQFLGGLIIAIILTSTLVYELVGPLVSKYALKKAGEISEE